MDLIALKMKDGNIQDVEEGVRYLFVELCTTLHEESCLFTDSVMWVLFHIKKVVCGIGDYNGQ